MIVRRPNKVVVLGITGRQGTFWTEKMISYGTQVVAGVTPGRGGEKFEARVPVFDTVAQAAKATGANASCSSEPLN